MPSQAMASLDELLQSLIDGVERSDWDQLDQLAGKLIPSLAAICAEPPVQAGDSVPVAELLRKLQTAIELCSVRQAQISPLLDALSSKTPDRS
jgi:hypothetical protein